ncbi:MAG: hypothetical protein IH831_00660 [Planctomycetes bacterium]|nr:hypothetical protein [Planctomycetota bacterium]
MKTERRHDLETNELARWAAAKIEKIKPYSTQLVGGVVVLLGMAVVGSMWSSVSESQQEAAWDAYALAVNTSDMEMDNLQRVATNDAHAGTVMQEWAFATWADRQLALASQAYLIDRTDTKERLRRVVSVYEQLAESAGDEQLRNRARYGLAQVYEMQNRLDDARRQYDLVQGDLEAIARVRADHMLAPGVQEAYDWLATAELPRRALRDAPGTPGSRPAFEAELPDTSSVPLNLGTRSLEEIFGRPSEGESQDRYETSSAPAEKESFEDIFGETPPAETAAPADSATETATEDANEP